MPATPKNNIHVQISHIREKLKVTGLQIETEYGLGARLLGKLEIDGTIR